MGILLALFSTLVLSFADAGKKRLTHTYSNNLVVCITLMVGLLVNIFVVLLISGIPEIDWGVLYWTVPVATVAIVLGESFFMTALRSGEFSLVMPLKAVSPLITLLVGFLWDGQLPNAYGAVGVLVTCVGSYFLFREESSSTLVAPLKAMLRSKAALFMVLSATMFPVIGLVHKDGAAASSDIFHFSLIMVFELGVFALLVLRRGGSIPTAFRRDTPLIIGTGILWGAGVTAMFASFSFTALIVYIAVITQLQPLLSIPIAKVLLKEEKAYARALPTLLMIFGVVLVVASEYLSGQR